MKIKSTVTTKNNRPAPGGRRPFLKLLAGSLAALATLNSLAAEKAAKAAIKAKTSVAKLFKRGDSGYERARHLSVWNERKSDRYPDGIFYPENDQDVVDAVLMARKKGWQIGMCSGGHNWIGNHMREDGLLINLSRMKDIQIDAEAKTVSIQPAVLGRDLQTALTAHGLRFPTATCPTVAMGGYLLGGGASFTSRIDGAACYGIEAADVVLATGELIHATDESHPEIMWAIRGSGPAFFAIVTRFYLKTKPLYASMMTSAYVFPADISRELMNWHLAISPTLPLEVTHNWFAVKSVMPDYPGIPIMLSVVAFADSDAEALKMLEVFETSPLLSRALHHYAPMPWTYDFGFGSVNRLYPRGFRYRSETLWVDSSQEGFVDLVAAAVETLPTDHAHILWAPYSTEHSHFNACNSVDSDLAMHFYGVSQGPEEDTAMDEWTNSWMDKFRRFSFYGGAGKINDNNIVQFPKYFLKPDNMHKVDALRKKYDPNSVFKPILGTPRSKTA